MVQYFPGIDYLVKVLEVNGVECDLAGTIGCCGAPMLHGGDVDSFVDGARTMVSKLAGSRAGRAAVRFEAARHASDAGGIEPTAQQHPGRLRLGASSPGGDLQALRELFGLDTGALAEGEAQVTSLDEHRAERDKRSG